MPPGVPFSGPHGLDLWIGEWDCTWENGGGTNRISKEFDGRVVVEASSPTLPIGGRA